MQAMTEPSTQFTQIIQEHLELKRRNAELEGDMPLSRYMEDDPFENHPLFKTEEQARIEDTNSGQDSIEDVPRPVSWPTEDTFIDEPAPAAPAAEGEQPAAGPDSESDEGLWTRSRDFDWGD
jgi:hypothetical protein